MQPMCLMLPASSQVACSSRPWKRIALQSHFGRNQCTIVHLKLDGWNTSFLQMAYFQWLLLLVLGNVLQIWVIFQLLQVVTLWFPTWRPCRLRPWKGHESNTQQGHERKNLEYVLFFCVVFGFGFALVCFGSVVLFCLVLFAFLCLCFPLFLFCFVLLWWVLMVQFERFRANCARKHQQKLPQTYSSDFFGRKS